MARIDWTEFDNSESTKELIPVARALDGARAEVKRLREELTKAERERDVLQDRQNRLIREQSRILWEMVRAADAQ